MATSYWLDLFSGQTWDEFLKAGAAVSGFRSSQKSAAKKIQPGDRFVCYVVGISRFIGILEVTSVAYWDESTIWTSDPFPVRFAVKPVVTVPFDNAIPVVDLRNRLEIFSGAEEITNFGYLFQGSLRRISFADGALITRELEKQKLEPVARPVDRKKLYKSTAYSRVNRAESEAGPVTVPGPDEAPDIEAFPVSPESTTHTEIQSLLLKLGSEMGLNVWVARNDRSKEFQGSLFSATPRLVKELPHQFSEAVQKTIELIDVLWLKRDAIVGAFEIESTTSIYSGLLRMSDLISMQPNLSIPLYIVAPDERRKKVVEEINRPTFANLKVPMSQICRFISFSALKDTVKKNREVTRYLPPEFVWEEVAESCELDPT